MPAAYGTRHPDTNSRDSALTAEVTADADYRDLCSEPGIEFVTGSGLALHWRPPRRCLFQRFGRPLAKSECVATSRRHTVRKANVASVFGPDESDLVAARAEPPAKAAGCSAMHKDQLP